jgi:hypothetical protein
MRLLAALPLFCAACLGTPDAPAPAPSEPDAEAPPRPRFTVEITDRLGRGYVGPAPTWPRIHVIANVPIIDPTAIFLVRGMSREALEDDLASAPLRASTREATLPTTSTFDPRGVVLEPTSHARRGEELLVAVAPWAVESEHEVVPFVAVVTIDTDESAGAWVADTWPADATYAVPSRMPFVAVRFDGRVNVGEGDVFLRGPEGRVPGTSAITECSAIGWSAGTCVRFDLRHPLTRGARHRFALAADHLDLTGAPTGPLEAGLVTAASDVDPVTFAETPCTADEARVGPACVFVDDRRAILRVSATGPARFFARGAGRASQVVAPRGDARLAFDGLDPETELAVELALVDLTGHEEARLIRIRTAPPLPEIDISEVCSDPRGSEPAQEWVELLNSGAMPIDLAGYALADREDRAGDIVERAVVVPAGGHVLLVSDAFDPNDPIGPAIPGGVPLVRLGTSLGSGGLSNAGEPLFLRDPEGRRVSAAPALSTGPGLCARRRRGHARSGDEDAFELGECTPGRPP